MVDRVISIAPSPPGYEFSAADLQRATLPTEAVARLIARKMAGDETVDDVTALLAGILRVVAKQSTYAQLVPFTIPAWHLIQLQGGDDLRNYFELQNVGGGDLMVSFESGSNTIRDFSSAAGQTELTLKQASAFRVVAGGAYSPFVAPINPITLFTLGTATNGVLAVGRPR